MEKKMITGTIFMFLLFAVSAIALDPTGLTPSTKPTTVPVIPTEGEASSKIVKTTPNDQSPESEQTQTFVITTTTTDPAPLRIFSRSLPIQRHSFDRTTRIPLRFVRSHPCRKFKKTFPAKMSYGNDMILSDKTTSVNLEEISDPVPTKWLEFKHKYGHRHHHHHHDKDEKFEMKFGNDGEKKTKEHKGGFMRRVRKFLKHTFD